LPLCTDDNPPQVCACAGCFHALMARDVPNAPHKIPDPWQFGRVGGEGLRGISYRRVDREFSGVCYSVRSRGEGGLRDIYKGAHIRNIAFYDNITLLDRRIEASGDRCVQILGELVLELLRVLHGGGVAEAFRKRVQFHRWWCGARLLQVNWPPGLAGSCGAACQDAAAALVDWWGVNVGVG
jgi:hypothetical protein